MARLSIAERFHSKYEPVPWSGCWIWTAATKEHGYGVLGRGKRSQGLIKAHRLSFLLHKGKIPRGNVVMHQCNNPSCVNPDHLKAGTRKENQQYMVKCNRHKVPDNTGEKAKWAKLSASAAQEIIDAYATRSRGTATELAKKFNVSRSTITEIWRGKNWASLR